MHVRGASARIGAPDDPSIGKFGHQFASNGVDAIVGRRHRDIGAQGTGPYCPIRSHSPVLALRPFGRSRSLRYCRAASLSRGQRRRPRCIHCPHARRGGQEVCHPVARWMNQWNNEKSRNRLRAPAARCGRHGPVLLVNRLPSQVADPGPPPKTALKTIPTTLSWRCIGQSPGGALLSYGWPVVSGRRTAITVRLSAFR